MRQTALFLTTLASYFSIGTAEVAQDGHTGKLPALGWNSWNAYHCDITAEKFLSAAQKLVDLGLKDAGYEYVNIDDCWSEKERDSKTQRIVVNSTRFPDGINGLADQVHALGLKIGIYSSAGTLTCAGYPASLEFEDVDAETWAEWGIDYLKYDNCNVPTDWQDEYVYCHPDHVKAGANGTCSRDTVPNLAPDGYDWSKSKSAERYRRMRDALNAQKRTIFYSLCSWGTADVFSWGNATSQSWRMSGDISAKWTKVKHILNINSFKLNSVDFWGHNDADMLEVNNGNLTLAEQRTHFALWAAMKSPLLIGTDLATISSDEVAILANKHLLAFSQDPVNGKPATPYKWGTNADWTYNDTFPAEYWSGKCKEGTMVLLFNPYDVATSKSALWSEVPGLKGHKSYSLKDAWTGRNLGCVASNYTVTVAAHDTAVIIVGKAC
ncbi:glycoside hydrolase family 27 protein [Atractiella rhizophila]|nr:glycoside hydrolase family 27 protein [Atractiella rhizophila]